MEGGDSIFSVINIYTYGVLRIHEMDNIKKAHVANLFAILDLIFKIIFDILFAVIYLLLMIALFLALVTRGIMLWVYLILSPVFGLMYFFGKSKE